MPLSKNLTPKLEGLRDRLEAEKVRLLPLIQTEPDRIKRHDLRGDLNMIELRLVGINQFGIDPLVEE